MNSWLIRSRQQRTRFAAKQGFTLIELLLVVVILGILASLVIPRFTRRAAQARVVAARQDIASIGMALDSYEQDCDGYPTTEQGLQALITQPGNAKNWQGSYLKKTSGVPKDPWGNPYVYRCPGQHNTDGYDLYSFGPDGQEGGGDDIDNWTD